MARNFDFRAQLVERRENALRGQSGTRPDSATRSYSLGDLFAKLSSKNQSPIKTMVEKLDGFGQKYPRNQLNAFNAYQYYIYAER